MSGKDTIMALGKVIIAAAWADGEITLEETNSLKDLLFWVPHASYKHGTQITGRDWAELEIYMQSPVGEDERTRLVVELQDALRSSQDRELALAALDELIRADGVVSDEELSVMEEIKSAIESGNLGIFTPLAQLIRGPLQRRSQAVKNAPNREEHLDDFIRNRIYYALRERTDWSANVPDISDAEVRKLSLAGGLMARVATVDREINEDEFARMVNSLQTGWKIPYEAAALVVEVAVSEVSADLDYFRLTREFFSSTTEDEQVRFLDVLFSVAAADGRVTHYENEEIRRIALSLNLTHQQYIDAKLKTPRE